MWVNLDLFGVPSAPLLEVSATVQYLPRGNSDPIVTVFGFADEVLQNLTPRVPEGEFWESTGQQDSMALFLFLECQLPESHSQAPVCVLFQVHHIFLPSPFVPHGSSLNVSMCRSFRHKGAMSRESFVKLQLFKLLTFLGERPRESHTAISLTLLPFTHL